MIIPHEIYKCVLDSWELYVETPLSKVTLLQTKFLWKMDFKQVEKVLLGTNKIYFDEMVVKHKFLDDNNPLIVVKNFSFESEDFQDKQSSNNIHLNFR